MTSPKISVVIPSFNKVRYIDQTLKSIISQDYRNIEIIVQDGGSNDGTLEIVKKYAAKYPKLIKWESKKDKGQLDAVNKGMKKATGDIVTFINADDSYTRGALNFVAEAYLDNPKALWFAGRGIVVDSKGQEIARGATWYKNLLLTLNSYFLLLVTNYLIQPSVFLLRKSFDKYGPFGGTSDFIMEYGLWLKIGKVQMPVVVDKTLSHFRIEATTKTKRMFRELLAEDERIVRISTGNYLILLLHKLHNLGRKLIGRYV